MGKAKDYSNGKIYMLKCNVTGLVYYGSTAYKYLSQRFREHKKDYKIWLEGKRGYISSFEVIKNGNYDMILVELYPCSCVEELKSRERFYMENNACVNVKIPYRSQEEWDEYYKNYRQEYIEKNPEYFKAYYENHKEKYQIYHKEYEVKNKDRRTEQKLIWTNANKEQLNTYRKKYAEENKDKIANYKKEWAESRKEKVQCECGSNVSKLGLNSHLKTKLHQNYLSTVNKET